MKPWLVAVVVGVVAFAVTIAATADDGSTVAPRGEEGKVLFARMGCGSCHTFEPAGAKGEIGPDLATVLPGHTQASLMAFIANPTPDTIMPRDYEERMSRSELDALAAWLLASR